VNVEFEIEPSRWCFDEAEDFLEVAV